MRLCAELKRLLCSALLQIASALGPVSLLRDGLRKLARDVVRDVVRLRLPVRELCEFAAIFGLEPALAGGMFGEPLAGEGLREQIEDEGGALAIYFQRCLRLIDDVSFHPTQYAQQFVLLPFAHVELVE